MCERCLDRMAERIASLVSNHFASEQIEDFMRQGGDPHNVVLPPGAGGLAISKRGGEPLRLTLLGDDPPVQDPAFMARILGPLRYDQRRLGLIAIALGMDLERMRALGPGGTFDVVAADLGQRLREMVRVPASERPPGRTEITGPMRDFIDGMGDV